MADLDKNNVCRLRVTSNGKKYSISKVPILHSGTFTRYGQIFMTDPSTGSYYMIELNSSYEMVFTSVLHTNNEAIPNLQVRTTLISK